VPRALAGLPDRRQTYSPDRYPVHSCSATSGSSSGQCSADYRAGSPGALSRLPVWAPGSARARPGLCPPTLDLHHPFRRTRKTVALHLEKRALIGGHDVNGASGSKGTFATTWFWLTDALQRIGRTAQDTDLLERLLSPRNDGCVLSVDYDPLRGAISVTRLRCSAAQSLTTSALTLRATNAPIRLSATGPI